MQLRNMKLMLVTLGAMSMVLTGCPEEMQTLTCTADADCLESELCHPTAKVCVQTCTSSADCPDTAKSCAAMGAGSSQMICQCSTDALCNQGRETADLACDPTSKVCVPKCTADADCAAGQTCDTTAGICKATAQTCNPANQPGTCSYGQVCSATANKCEAAPQGTCAEATGTGVPTWNQSGGTAPVIVSATAQRLASTNATNECANGVPAGLVTIRFYAPGGLTAHTSLSDLQNHVKFRNLSTGNFFGANFSRQDPPVNAVEGTMQIGIGCGNSTETAALYIANEAGQTSNVVCVSW
jgi:Cys-rich repeat protein